MLGSLRAECSTLGRVSQEESREGDSSPASHMSFDAVQDTVDFLGCKHTLSVHIQFFIHQRTHIIPGIVSAAQTRHFEPDGIYSL